MKLNQLADNGGARYKSKRVGRGSSSGKGKTCGRGVKGQKARTGVSIKGFEGGQTPLHRRLPHRGFNSLNRQEFHTVNLDRLQAMATKCGWEKGHHLTPALLVECGLVRNLNHPIKILAKGAVTSALAIEVHALSKKAQASIENAGGTITLIPS